MQLDIFNNLFNFVIFYKSNKINDITKKCFSDIQSEHISIFRCIWI